ncbi:MAG TPA: tRNA pseudouridine(55) synthase TruB, partial [Hyphomonas atlantica]|nr:tRNA pseudouridine(55) synthase TruB [Hyphomonas atlantica]
TSGKGFYVRAMARDLAFDLECEGHISQLRRTRVGQFGAATAIPLSRIEETEDPETLMGFLQPIHAVLEGVPSVDITREEAGHIRHGRSIVLLPHLIEAWQGQKSEDTEDRSAIAVCEGKAVALGEIRAGQFEPGRVFMS